MKPLLILLTVALSISGAGRAADDVRVVRLLGSKANFEILRQAERVEACPLIIDWPASTKGLVSSEGATLTLSASDTALLKEKLLAPASYGWSAEEPDCMPDYHLRLRAFRGTGRVDIDFCFGCDVLQFHRGTEVFGHRDFTPASKELFAVFLRLFPDDPTIRLLKERRTAWEKKRKNETDQRSKPASEPPPSAGRP